jgi:hypothetical protein
MMIDMGIRPLDSRTRAEQQYYRSREFRPVLCQLRSTDGKYVHLCSANNEPEVLEEPGSGSQDLA